MIRELRHRSGNLFSQLLALFSQTAKNSKNLAELVPKYEARVLALANAHRLVTEGGWKSASLIELLNILLAPYLDRITFAGPNVFLEADPTFGLSMAIHELTTNASKHGSLSTRTGRVEVTWQVQRTDLGLTLLLELERARRTGAEASAAHRLRLAPRHHGDRTPAQRHRAHDLQPRRPRCRADGAAHARALAGRRTRPRSPRTCRSRLKQKRSRG